MYKYLLEQEKILKNAIDKKTYSKELYEYGKIQVKWISHERIVHLMVTMFFALMLFLSYACAIIFFNAITVFLFIMLAMVEMFYIVHYYRLENGVQRLYVLLNQIYKELVEHNMF